MHGALLALALAVPASPRLALAEPVPPTAIEAAVEALAADPEVANDACGIATVVRGFYARRGHAPAWLDHAGSAPRGRALAAWLGRAGERGLDPSHYAAGPIAAALDALDDPLQPRPPAAALARLDVSLTAAALRLVGDARHGRADPRDLGVALPADPVRLDLGQVADALAEGADPEPLADAAEPRWPQYRALRAALPRLRALAVRLDAEAPLPVPPRPPAAGEPFAGASRLAARLLALGDLPAAELGAASAPAWSPPLAAALARFQARHGLHASGRLGPATAEALAVPLSRRARQVELAMERWRWLPSDLDARAVLVNLSAFRLEAYQPSPSGPLVALAMDVIVGADHPAKRTPLLARRLEHVAFSPWWEVPRDLAARELLPKFADDPGLAARLGYVLQGPRGQEPVTPRGLERWARGELRLRQAPGPHNALGAVKFLFPNDQAVFLHDTPDRRPFERPRRALSSGCVRVADAAALAAWVLSAAPGWDPTAIEEAMARGEPTWAAVPDRPWVFFGAATAVLEADGTLRFAADLYGHDAALERTLEAGPRRLAGYQARGWPESRWTKS